MPSLEVSDFEGGLGTLVEEVEDLVVEFVDPGTPIVQVHRDSCPAALTSIPRIIVSRLRAPQGPRASGGVEGRDFPARERPVRADGQAAQRDGTERHSPQTDHRMAE